MIGHLFHLREVQWVHERNKTTARQKACCCIHGNDLYHRNLEHQQTLYGLACTTWNADSTGINLISPRGKIACWNPPDSRII
jgi:hypothetical protein